MAQPKDTSKMKSRTRKVGAAVTAVASVAAGMVFAATPATASAAALPTATASAAAFPAAASSTADFSIEYGASYYKGTVTWSNRSVDVDGAFKATGCRRVYGRAFAGSTSLDFKSSSTWCNRSGPVRLPLEANVVGGSDNVWVYMTDENQKFLKGQTCYRSSGSCVDGLR